MASIVTAGTQNISNNEKEKKTTSPNSGNIDSYASQTLQNTARQAISSPVSSTNTGTSSGAMGSPTQNTPQYTNTKAPVTYDENGNAAVRQSLVNMGVDTNRIGYNPNTNSVTIDGKDTVNPNNVNDGISYASSGAIERAAQQAYKQSGDELVSAAHYGAESGFGNMVKWDGGSGTLSVGGTNITPVYVSNDGIAYVKKSEIEAAIAAAKENAGVTGDKEVKDNFDREYKDRIEAAQRAVDNFSYDPNKDKEYQAYAAYQMLQKQKLAEDAAARAQDATGGYGAAAVSSLADSLYSSQQDIAAAIPEYAQQAYNRTQQSLDNQRNIAQSDYLKAYQANYDAANRYQSALDSEYDRRVKEKELAQKEKEWESTNYRNGIDDEFYRENAEASRDLNKLSVRSGEENVYGQKLANDTSRNSGISDLIAMNGGKWTADAAGNVGYTTPDGKFISYNDITGGEYPNYWDYYKNQAYYPQMGSNEANLAYQQMLLEKGLK